MPILVDKDGVAHDVPDEAVGYALSQGMVPESSEGRFSRAGEAVAHEKYGGIGGAVTSGVLGGLRGATLGASDAVLGALGASDDLKGYRDENPVISGVSNVAGALAPALLAGPAGATESLGALGEGGASAVEGIGSLRSIMAASPAAKVARIGSDIAGLGEGGGLLARVGATAAGGAVEGAAQNAGSYISDVALGDRKLSADGFVGAMGQGALWGGVAGGVLKLSSEGLTAARRLFPGAEMTADAAKSARSDATRALTDSLNDTDTMSNQAGDRLRQMREVDEVGNPALKRRLDDIRENIEKIEAQEKMDAKLAEQLKVSKSQEAIDWLGEQTSRANSPPTAAPEAPAPRIPPTLEEQLAGTKAAIDGGKTIGEVGRGQVLDDALNAEYAKTSAAARQIYEPLQAAKKSSTEVQDWLAKYGPSSKVGKFERQQGHIADALDKEADSVADPEFSAAMRKSNGFDDEAPSIGPPRPTGKAIVEAQQPVSAKIDKALSSKPEDFADEVGETAPIITKHEAAHAELAEVLGETAPPTAQARAQAFRGAQKEAADKSSAQAATVADSVSKANPASIGKQLLAKAKDAGTAYEALRMMGVPLPDPKNIPVIGPVLSAYLKAKVLGKAFGRFGGKVATTSETTIASKSAVLRQRIYKAADAMLDGSARATAGAAPVAGGAVAALGHVLFDNKDAAKPYSSKPSGGELGDLFLARSAEINAAMRPGAIADAVKAKVQTSDPEALQEIIHTQERKLQYLSDNMPRPSTPTGVLEDRVWLPSKAEATGFAQIVGAVEDPASVFENAAKGQASSAEIDAVRTVYPALYADAQQHVLQRIVGNDVPPMDFALRAALSRTWGLPLDTSSQPDHAAFLQAGYIPQPPAPQPSAPMGQPTLAGPVNLGQRMLTQLEHGG